MIYVTSDWHGYLALYDEAKKILSPDDTVYFLGDIIDRGPEPWKIFKTLYKDPQFILLCGNHEDMLIKALNNQLKSIELLRQNGGYETYMQVLQEKDVEKWVKRLQSLPLMTSLNNEKGQNLILCHAGYTPKEGFIPTSDDLLWNRNHIYNNWSGDDNTIVIHGHTPIASMNKRFKKANDFYETERFTTLQTSAVLYYCDKHKIDVDMGTVKTHMAVLLNIDTFEEIILKI